MNIIDYVKKNKEITFKEKPFNEIDNVIFSVLSYINFSDIVSKNKRNKITIENARNLYFSKYSLKEMKNNILAVKEAINLLDILSKTKRYKDLFLHSYKELTNLDQQFSALSIDINKDLVFISFEGTDQSIVGWEEDCKLAYKFPVSAQKSAIRYLNYRYIFSKSKIILGGHSKGGNLALVAGMYSSIFNRNKIIKIYNNDGPGLKDKQINSYRYKRIDNKLVTLIPNHSVVGLLLKNNGNYEVIKSNKRFIMSHDVNTWQLLDDKFIRTNLSTYSKIIENSVIKWLNKYDNKQLEIFIESIFIVIKHNNITSLTQIINDPLNIVRLLKTTNKVSEDAKNMIKDFIRTLIDLNKEYVIQKLR